MVYKSNPLKEIFHPKIAFAQLKEAERVKNATIVVLLLLFFNVVLSLLRAYFGIGTEELTKHLDRYTGGQLAFLQLLFAFGHALGGLCVPLLFLFIVDECVTFDSDVDCAFRYYFCSFPLSFFICFLILTL